LARPLRVADMKRVAVYAGSFDPFTLGHLDVVQKVRSLFDELHLVIADNPKKTPLFTVAERRQQILETLKLESLDRFCRIGAAEGLVVDFCSEIGAQYLVRGLRAVSDFDGEFSLAVMNRRISASLTTIHIMADEKYFFLSSSLVKEVAGFGRSVEDYVSKPVAEAMIKKMKPKVTPNSKPELKAKLKSKLNVKRKAKRK
jgi:pantetheine-phosphate adenylyltransferase